MESGGKCDRTKGHELRVVNWGKLSKSSSFRFLLVSFHLLEKDAPFLQVLGGLLSLESLIICLRVEGGGQRVLLAAAFFQILSI